MTTRIKLKGINRVRKVLADGTVLRIHYAWRGKGAPALVGKEGSAEYIASYNAAIQGRYREVGKASDRTVVWLIRDYLTNKGSKFNTEIKPRTQQDYRRLLSKIEKKFGKMKLAWIERDESHAEFRTWRGELAATSRRQADYAWSVLSALFAHAIDFRYGIKTNPCHGLRRLYSSTRIDIIWSENQIQAFLTAANAKYPELVLPMMIALWTGLHQTDVLTLPWSAYDGQFIRLSQRKGDRPLVGLNKRLEIPVAAPLQVVLDAAKRLKKSTIMCLNKGKRPWVISATGADGFRGVWQKCAKDAGVHKSVAFTDLRGTAVTRLWQAGERDLETIGVFTGHTKAEVNEILRVHYLHRDKREEGLKAIKATEALFAPKAEVTKLEVVK